MAKKLHIQSFIEEHPSDWENLVSGRPYCIKVSRDRMFGRNLVLFKYRMVDDPDFSIPLVRECRGLILDEDTLEPVCVPFFKFFNAGEPNADEIDWKTAFSSMKIDGSIIKVVRLGNDILVSTNGTINAYKAPIQDQIGFVGKSFGGLFELAVENARRKNEEGKVVRDWLILPMGWLKGLLDEGFTYMFELTSKYNKIVVPYDKPEIHLIGIRNNSTLEEMKFFEHPLSKVFHTPELFPLGNLDDCVSAAGKMSFDQEGFVVCDANFHRLKVKSPAYVVAHHLRGEGGTSVKRLLELVKTNEIDEFLSYFPEYAEEVNRVKDVLDGEICALEWIWDEFNEVKSTLPTRKDQALWIVGHCKNPGFLFAMLDEKSDSIRKLVSELSAEKILKIFELENKLN